MAQGHGTITNLSNFLSYPFQYNPQSVRSGKAISWFKAPNIGEASRQLFFDSSDNKEVRFRVEAIDMVSPQGVQPDMSFWEALSNPAPGLLGIAGSFFGNKNFPPPKVLFQFGTSLIPMPWYVRDVQITADLFEDDEIGGLIGIPKRAVFDVQLELDELSDFFKANQVAEKASEIEGSLRSQIRNTQRRLTGGRSEYQDIG